MTELVRTSLIPYGKECKFCVNKATVLLAYVNESRTGKKWIQMKAITNVHVKVDLDPSNQQSHQLDQALII